RFMEQVTGVAEPNISAWRRAVCGDLTSCFDFTAPDYSIPQLPDTKALMARADAGTKLPGVQLPAVGAQSMPVQETGTRPHRRLPYRPWAEAAVDRDTGLIACTLRNDGGVAYPFTVYPNTVYAFAGTPYTVAPGASRTHTWDAATTDGRYDFTVHGPDGFVRRYAGTVVRAEQDDVAVPVVNAVPDASALTFTLANAGRTAVTFTLTPNDYAGTEQTVRVGPNTTATAVYPLDQGRYDVTVTAATGTRFTQRYAGTLH
ncbi:phospholipase domain-containing protein, partial [Kitasatospora sp. NPDC004723]|uniref:phospholipase domain-containing protein n=1 Tax=Kitasatospora sp. NPDC004723 TaxID=3154288 RepID=UPI0033AC1E1E